LVGAVALASAAYTVGSQADGGSATAASGDRQARDGGPPPWPERPPGPGFSDLADELGVDAGELEDALQEFREQSHEARSNAFAKALADALGKPVDDVEAALDRARPDDGDPGRPHFFGPMPLRELASELDVTREELRRALREVWRGADSRWEQHHEDLVKFLAERFNLSEEKVEEALPEPPRGGPGAPWRVRCRM
jgi:hypothetical protein